MDDASDQLKRLRSSGFFTVYPSFGDIASDFRRDFGRYLDNSNKYLTYAVEGYFAKLFRDDPENPEVRIKCRPKEKSGAQVSFKTL